MDTKKWRQLINESSVIIEAVDFLNKDTDHSTENIVQLTLDRKIGGLTAWYRLETDGWWRRIHNPGKGYGILVKKFKISGQPKYKYLSKTQYIEYPVLISYIPLEYSGEVDWDQPGNIEKAKGIMMINTDRTNADGKEVEKFVNQQISRGTYQP